MAIDISLNPFDWFDNTQKDQATADRNLRGAQFDESLAFQKEQYNQAKKVYFWERDRQDNYLQRLIKDAQAAGISPLAALGSRGASPATFRTGFAPSPQGASPLPANKDMMAISFSMEALKALSEIKKNNAQANNKSPTGQTPTTHYGPLKSQDLVVSNQYTEPSAEPSLRYARGPDGTRIPVGTADIEEMIAGFIIEKFGRYRVNQNMDRRLTDKRHMFMGPDDMDSYYPDRTNRFDPDIDTAP